MLDGPNVCLLAPERYGVAAARFPGLTCKSLFLTSDVSEALNWTRKNRSSGVLIGHYENMAGTGQPRDERETQLQADTQLYREARNRDIVTVLAHDGFKETFDQLPNPDRNEDQLIDLIETITRTPVSAVMRVRYNPNEEYVNRVYAPNIAELVEKSHYWKVPSIKSIKPIRRTILYAPTGPRGSGKDTLDNILIGNYQFDILFDSVPVRVYKGREARFGENDPGGLSIFKMASGYTVEELTEIAKRAGGKIISLEWKEKLRRGTVYKKELLLVSDTVPGQTNHVVLASDMEKYYFTPEAQQTPLRILALMGRATDIACDRYRRTLSDGEKEGQTFSKEQKDAIFEEAQVAAERERGEMPGFNERMGKVRNVKLREFHTAVKNGNGKKSRFSFMPRLLDSSEFIDRAIVLVQGARDMFMWAYKENRVYLARQARLSKPDLAEQQLV